LIKLTKVEIIDKDPNCAHVLRRNIIEGKIRDIEYVRTAGQRLSKMALNFDNRSTAKSYSIALGEGAQLGFPGSR